MANVTTTILLNKFRKILDNIPETVENAIFKNENEILNLQKQQIYDGKSNTGEDLHPFYTEDPYFKTPGQAQGYIKWKQQITPNPKRNPNAPNLYINSYVHRNIIIVKEGKNIIFDINSRVDFGEELKAKYKNLLGLNPTNELFINNERIIPELWELIAKHI